MFHPKFFAIICFFPLCCLHKNIIIGIVRKSTYNSEYKQQSGVELRLDHVCSYFYSPFRVMNVRVCCHSAVKTLQALSSIEKYEHAAEQMCGESWPESSLNGRFFGTTAALSDLLQMKAAETAQHDCRNNRLRNICIFFSSCRFSTKILCVTVLREVIMIYAKPFFGIMTHNVFIDLSNFPLKIQF